MPGSKKHSKTPKAKKEKEIKPEAKEEVKETPPVAEEKKPKRGFGRKKIVRSKTVKEDIEIKIDDNIKRGQKSLVIVESPSKAKTINKYLGKEFHVEASVGHIKNLPSSKLGIDVENGYTPEYRVIDGKQEVIRKLKTMAASTQKVYIATDPDREGEAIAWHIADEIKPHNDHISRVLFNEITKSGIEEAMRHPAKIDEKLVNAQQARRVLDRIVGYKVSPFLWSVVRRGTSAGRVQSVALRLVCEREAAIEAFVAQEYWSIRAKVEKQGDAFMSVLHSIDGKKPLLDTEHTTKTFVDDIRRKDFVIKDIRKRETRRNPSPPFTTSSLQQEASRKCGFSPKMTMMLAQQLYEGIEMGSEGLSGLITYMRTDSTRVADSALEMVRGYIYNSYGKDFLPGQANVFKSKKTNVQDAHEAIRPTTMKFSPKEAARFLTPQQSRLYELIWNRFVASQMMPAVMDQTTVDITAEEYLFRATGSIITFRGFLQVYEEGKDEDPKNEEQEEEEEATNLTLPAHLKTGDRLNVLDLMPLQHFTKPPARYTESSLIKELDNLGIGRPSTYAMMVGTVAEREYVDLRERKLYATELGRAVNQILSAHFAKIFNVQFTADMEEELDKIESGELGYKKVLDDFYRPFMDNMNHVESRKAELKESLQEKTDEVCELCGKPMIIKWGRYGKFMACSGYPDCKNIKKLVKEGESAQPEMTDEKCPNCGSPMVVRVTKSGKFLGCSNYPKCKTAMPHPDDILKDVVCPKDGGQIVRRKSRYGKYFYGCRNYPNCDYISWNEPINQRCPECDAAFMVKKMSKRKGDFLLCMTCNHEMPLQMAAMTETPGSEDVKFDENENV